MKAETTAAVLFGALLLVAATTGCVRYLEQETPAGTVPPPPATVKAQAAQNVQPPAAPVLQTVADKRWGDEAQGTIQQFAKVYAAKGTPRIAVFFNRALSDDVREWRSNARLSVTRERTKVQEEAGKETKQTATVGGAAVAIEQPADAGARPSPDEQWMWAFEDGFIQPLLDAKVKVVDRATIVRLAAAKEGRRTDVPSVAPKTIEVNALKDSADLFVEILVSRSPSSLYGYEFKASAKEVKTGQIVANVTSLRWRPEDRRGRIVIAGPTDYQVIDGIRIPPVGEIAADLAVDLMNALDRTWAE